MVKGKNEFWKSLVLQHKVWKNHGNHVTFAGGGIITYKYEDKFVEIISFKYDICLNHLLSFKDLSPNSWYNCPFEVPLTHFRLMFHLRINQAAVFYKQNVTLPQVFFKHFASNNQLPSLPVSGALVENELIALVIPNPELY